MADDLTPEEMAPLVDAPFSYPEVGATAATLPGGYRHIHRSRTLRRRDFETAADEILSWRLHERAGLAVVASSRRVRPDDVVVLRLGRGPLSIRIPCRVVYVIEEQDRAGFAYGTLPGHPESGEERFLLERQGDGTIAVCVTAFSRPASLPARVGGPLTRAFQGAMTNRYLRALDS